MTIVDNGMLKSVDFEITQLDTEDSNYTVHVSGDAMVLAGIALDTYTHDDATGEYLAAEYRLYMPVAGLDAVNNPRIVVHREVLWEDGGLWGKTDELVGVYELDITNWNPMAPNALQLVGYAWQSIVEALEHGDGSLPWSGMPV